LEILDGFGANESVKKEELKKPYLVKYKIVMTHKKN